MAYRKAKNLRNYSKAMFNQALMNMQQKHKYPLQIVCTVYAKMCFVQRNIAIMLIRRIDILGTRGIHHLLATY